MKPAEIQAVQAHLRKPFGSSNLMIRAAATRQRPGREVLAGAETIGTVDRDAEDGEVTITSPSPSWLKTSPTSTRAAPGMPGRSPDRTRNI